MTGSSAQVARSANAPAGQCRSGDRVRDLCAGPVAGALGSVLEDAEPVPRCPVTVSSRSAGPRFTLWNPSADDRRPDPVCGGAGGLTAEQAFLAVSVQMDLDAQSTFLGGSGWPEHEVNNSLGQACMTQRHGKPNSIAATRQFPGLRDGR